MKRKSIILVMLLVLSGLFVMQSCTKDETATAPTVLIAAVPANPVPVDATIIPFVGTPITISLAWEGTATSTIKWNVFFGDSEEPDQVATEITGNTFNVTVRTGGTYYWKVETIDAKSVKSTSPLWSVIVNTKPAAPATYVPANAAVNRSVNGPLTWVCSDPEGDDITYKVYLGKTSTLALAAEILNTTSYTPATTFTASTLYYWKVVAVDANGAVTEGPVQTFTTGLEAISTYTGKYLCDEPAEDYSYDISFAKVTSTTIKTTNYWNSGWAGTFTLDLTKMTYSMPTTVWGGYSGIEAGIIDPKTGKMVGTYTIWSGTSIIEQGVHTYTKATK